MKFLLRVEAVNLSAFTSDSQDLSTIRGGSMILLDSVDKLTAFHPDLRKVYSGASVGVFEVDAENDGAAEQLRRAVASTLVGTDQKIRASNAQYATFQVAISRLESDEDYQLTSAEVLTRVRVQQLQSPTVVLPRPADPWIGICEVDDLRPAVTETRRQGGVANEASKQKMKVSRATLDRRLYGIEEKHSLLARRAHCPEQEMVNDLEQLTDYPKAGLLHRKMAIISLDGNRFGEFARQCQTASESSAWSSFVQYNQDAFLHRLLSEDQDGLMTSWHWSGMVVTNAGEERHKKSAFRLEVLRWAGDDLLLVVPAWCGWWVLSEFYSCFGALPWPPAGGKPTGRQWAGRNITHGGCIVFAHYNAPIQPLIHLAETLTRDAKMIEANTFTYQVLESFDHLGANQREARMRRLPLLLRSNPELLVIDGDHMQDALSVIVEIRDRLPRKAIYEVLKALRRDGDNSAISDALSRYHAEKCFEEFCDALVPNVTDPLLKRALAWVHLSELWDYIVDPAHLPL